MKSTHTPRLFLALFILIVGMPPAASAADEEGFRGIPWGTDLSTHPEMRLISCEGAFCSYARSGDDLSMGEARVSSITYRTFRKHFTEVCIEAPAEIREGEEPGLQSGNFLALRQACRDLFGPTSFAASFEYLRAEQYRWEQTGIRKVLKINFNKNHMLLSIIDHDLLKVIRDGEGAPDVSGREGREELSGASREDSSEVSPARTDDAGGAAPGNARSGERESTSRSGFGKVGDFLRRIFVNDGPSAPPADLPGMNTP